MKTTQILTIINDGLMKRIFYVAFAALSICMAQPAAAQEYNVSSNEEGISLSDKSGNDVVSLRPSNDGAAGLWLKVAGMELQLRPSGSNSKAEELWLPKKNSDHDALIEAGIPTLSLHNAGMFNDDSINRITNHNARSIQINLTLADAFLPFTRNHSLGLRGRIMASWTNYYFKDFTLGRTDNGDLELLPVPAGTDISKLVTTAIRVPVELQFTFGSNFFVSVGGYGGLVIDSYTKMRKPKVKDKTISAAPFEAGLTARAGYGNWYVYCNYGMTDLFKTTTQPGIRTLTFGLATGLFD